MSGISCGSVTVPGSSCVDGVCRHSFTYEESTCGSPSADINVNITISAANILGGGPPSDPMVVHSMYHDILARLQLHNYYMILIIVLYRQQKHCF